MSVKLIKTFTKTLRQSLFMTQLSKVPARFVTQMDANVETNKDAANEDQKEHEFLQSKNSTRYKRRWFERKWEDPKPVNTDGDTEEKKSKTEERIKRKKMALLLGYCGANYYGMQRNPGVPTIEEDLLKALWEAKYITEEDFNNQQAAQFQRSSRTDKGVSAARQVVSLKLPLETNIEEINKRLPDCIRVFGVKRVTNKFNSKIKCNARTYSYTLPTFAFEPACETMEERKQYRITEEKLNRVKEVLDVYKGTKSYHNFTEKKHYQDPSASRYMMGFTVDRVFVSSDMEFAVLLVKGQSFMLHQIRKMVGLAVAVLRGHTSPDMMQRVFEKDKVWLPTAPGLGLVLDMVHYDRYAAKHQDHDSLEWQDTSDIVQKFKEDHIYPYIVQGETNDHCMAEWIDAKLSQHSYDHSEDNAEKEKENEMEEDSDGEDSTECKESNSSKDSKDV